MDRLTRPEVEVDQTAARFMGEEVKIQDIGDKLMHLILNGPTINSINKDTLRHLVRQLYKALQRYEDLEEQRRLLRLRVGIGDIVYTIIDNQIVPMEIQYIYINSKGRARYNAAEAVYRKNFRDHAFGRDVFVSKEAAEHKLKQIEED